jgi:hypothetical protein
MDANQVKTFCDVAVQLLPAISQYASLEAVQRSPEHEALLRQLRVMAGAVAHALMEVPRLPPPMPTPPNVGSPS